MDGQGGGLRHRRKEKRGVAYKAYDPISKAYNTYDTISNGTQWRGMVYSVEYNRGDSAIGVHRIKKKFKMYVRSCKIFVILRNEREHSRVPVIGLPVRRTVRRTRAPYLEQHSTSEKAHGRRTDRILHLFRGSA